MNATRVGAFVALAVLATSLLTACPSAPQPSPTPTPSLRPSPSREPSPSPPTPTADPAPALPPDLELEERVETYRVGGDSPGAILADIRKKGPGSYAGLTTYVTSFRWTSVELDNGRCRLVSPVVEMSITVTLPEVAPSTSGSARAYADSVIRGLRVHEDGHVRIAVASARDALHTLADLRNRTFPTCAEMADVANRKAERQIQIGQAAQRAFDQRTDHGRAVGLSG